MRALAEMENSGLVPLLDGGPARRTWRACTRCSARVDGGSELLRAGMVRTVIQCGSSKQAPVGMLVPCACVSCFGTRSTMKMGVAHGTQRSVTTLC